MQRSRTAGVYFIVLAVALGFSSPIAQAKSPYSMPTFGVSWASSTIDVSIPSRPAMARSIAVKAAELWNEAQLWFRATYFPKGKVYTFIIGSEPTDVLVDFSDYWSVSNYCPSMPLGVEGCTDVRWNDSRNITQAIVFLDTKRLTNSNNDSIFLALHEFGHALGLPDLPSSPTSPCQFQDLFCLYYANRYPSTLDLYTLHELAEGNRQRTVSLPSEIPYSYYIPVEGPNPTAPGTAVTVSTSLRAPVINPIQGWELNRLATLGLAAIIFFGIVTLFAFLARAKPRSRARGGPT